MKPFNIEEAKAGAAVITQEGHPVRVLCFDRTTRYGRHLVALVAIDGHDHLREYYPSGKGFSHKACSYDLFMAPVQRTVWVNLYHGPSCPMTEQCATYPTEEAARRGMIPPATSRSYIGTFPITYEE